MTLSVRDVLALFGTTCQFFVIFFDKVKCNSRCAASLDLYLVFMSVSNESAVLHMSLQQVATFKDQLLRQQWIVRNHEKLDSGCHLSKNRKNRTHGETVIGVGSQSF